MPITTTLPARTPAGPTHVVVDLYLGSTAPLLLPGHVGCGPWSIGTAPITVGRGYGGGGYGVQPYGSDAGERWPTTYDQLLRAIGVRAYWPLIERRGTQIRDVHGGYHGTASAIDVATQRTVSPLIGSPATVLALTGAAGQRIEVPHNIALQSDSEPWAIIAWIRPVASTSYQIIVAKRPTSGGPYPYSVQVAPAGLVEFRRATSSEFLFAASTTVVTDDAWHCVVAQYRDQRLEVWIDGVLEGSTVDPRTGTTNTQSVMIGAMPGGLVYAGGIGHVAYVARALRATEIAALAARGMISGPGSVDPRLLRIDRIPRTWRTWEQLRGIAGITLEIGDHDGEASRRCVGADIRGRRVAVSLVMPETGTWYGPVWDGVVAAVTQRRGVVEILAAESAAAWAGVTIPSRIVSADWAPYAPDPAPTTGALGQVVACGQGIGRMIPCRAVRAQVLDGDARRVAVTAIDPAGDTLVAPAHDYATGDGPITVEVVDGPYPGGLRPSAPYYAIAPSTDALQLAATPEAAAVSLPVDITSTTTGTVTLVSGRPASPESGADYAVAVGYVGVSRVYIDGEVVPPDHYEVLWDAATVRGRAVTIVRLAEDPGTAGVTADVHGTYPDDMPGLVHLWAWEYGIADRIGRVRLVPGTLLGASAAWSAGAQYRPTIDGILEGACSTGASGTRYWQTHRAPPYYATGTLGCWVRPRSMTGWQAVIGQYRSSGVPLWRLEVDRATRRLRWIEHGTPQWTSATGVLPSGWTHIVVSWAYDRVMILLDGQLVADVQRDAAIVTDVADAPICVGATGASVYRGWWGPIWIAEVPWTVDQMREAWAAAARAPVRAVRRWLEDAGITVDASRYAAALEVTRTWPIGSLACDAWLTEREPIGEVLGRLEAWPVSMIWAQHLAAIDVPGPVTTAVGPYGPRTGTAVDVGTARQAAADETVRVLRVRYDPRRDPRDGRIVGYARERTVTIHPGGQRELVVETPWVVRMADAERLIAWIVGRDRAATWVRSITTDMCAATHTVGDLVTVEALGPADVPAAYWQIRHIAYDPPRVQLECVSYDEALWAPTTTSAVVEWPRATAIDLSDAVIRMTAQTGAVELAIAYGADEIVRVPVGTQSHPDIGQWIVTGLSAHGALADGSDATYITAMSGTPWYVAEITPPVLGMSAIRRLEVRARVRGLGAEGIVLGWLASAPVADQTMPPPVINTITGAWAWYTAVWDRDPRDGAQWTPSRVRTLAPAIQALAADGAVDVAELRLVVVVSTAVGIDGLGWVRWWLRGPAATVPAAPQPLTDPPTITTWADLPVTLGASVPGTYWAWAECVDIAGGSRGILGPASATVN